MRPEEGRIVAVGHPHEALGPQYRLQGRLAWGSLEVACGFVVADWDPLKHCLTQPACTEERAQALQADCMYACGQKLQLHKLLYNFPRQLMHDEIHR